MKKFFLAAAATLGSAGAFATTTPVDYSSLTSAVDFSTVSTAIMAVAGSVIGLHIVTVGIKFVIRMVKA